ncbi:hypothetical protein QBC99_005296 [Beijerinckia sp. GAS462]|nr:hypothetical protein [Beijerinckia sp. GAS462]
MPVYSGEAAVGPQHTMEKREPDENDERGIGGAQEEERPETVGENGGIIAGLDARHGHQGTPG